MNSADAAKITVFSIQREYRAIIGQLVATDEIVRIRKLDQLGLRRFVGEKLLNIGPKVRVPGGSITVFEERLNQIAHQVFSFWKANGDSLATALRKLEGFKLATSVASMTTSRFDTNICRLCVYFDTLVLVCPVHEGPERLELRYGPRELNDSDEMTAKLHIAVNLINLILTEPLLATDTATPIVVVVPDFYASLANCREIDVFSGSKVIEHLTGKMVDASDSRSMLELAGQIRERYEADKKLKQVFDELVSSEYANHLPPDLRIDALRTAPFEVRAACFLANVGEANTEFNILNTCAGETAADPVILSHKQNIFRTYLEVGAKEAKERFDVALDASLVANGLLAEKMGFLEALTFDELRVMRSKGMLEQTREDLRREREKFRTAGYERLDIMSLSFADRIVEIIKEAKKTHTDKNGRLNSEIQKSAVYFAGACALGVASIALPQTLLLQALGIGYGITVGGTALEIGKAINEKRTEKERFQQNPLGVLYGALSYHDRTRAH